MAGPAIMLKSLTSLQRTRNPSSRRRLAIFMGSAAIRQRAFYAFARDHPRIARQRQLSRLRCDHCADWICAFESRRCQLEPTRTRRHGSFAFPSDRHIQRPCRLAAFVPPWKLTKHTARQRIWICHSQLCRSASLIWSLQL